jgi:hypothetical protein
MATKNIAGRRLFLWLGLVLLLLLVANILLFKRLRPPVPPPKPTLVIRPKLAIVIDDLGYDPSQARSLYRINPNITLAIIPLQPYSKQIAQAAENRGQEVLLHLPLEPRHYGDYNKMPHMLLVNMSTAELKRKLSYNLDNLPWAVGVNNHMGSRLTENEGKMRTILTELKQRGLFFIDSRTSSRSIAYSLAKQLGLKAGKRDIFLDNVDQVEAITSQLKQLVALAKQKGKALGIGHPRPNTLTALKRFFQSEKAQGVQLVPASELLD